MVSKKNEWHRCFLLLCLLKEEEPVVLVSWEGSTKTANTDGQFWGARQREETREINSSKSSSYLSDCCSKPERMKCHQGQHNLPWRYWKPLQILPRNYNKLLFVCHIFSNNFGTHLWNTEFWLNVPDRFQHISYNAESVGTN